MGKEDRARDTRRKVLLDAFVLDRHDRPGDEKFARRLRDWLGRELPSFLIRDADNELIGDLITAPKPKLQRTRNEQGTRMRA